ncbi:hypothetical protein Clacol_006214 [Clathrus columnatus]|uniref:Uncharacterized protein n=1 Tax=Clathrus columnatus TaxID=1419009 RepID=A0AAV5AHL5_9AGAM|nr:hypothetical protein Clacol_006214 [Clathrus columnatus]
MASKVMIIEDEPSNDQPRRTSPRHYRIGGYVINNDAATKWGSQLRGVELRPVRDSASIRKAVLQKTYPLGVNFRQVGEVPDVHWMLITQCEKFDGYKDMDPAEIPQFEPSEKDILAEMLINEAGMLSNHDIHTDDYGMPFITLQLFQFDYYP